jgi:hypothetical protein
MICHFDYPPGSKSFVITLLNLNWVQTSDLNLLTCGSDDLTYEENINIIKQNRIFMDIFCKMLDKKSIPLTNGNDTHIMSFLINIYPIVSKKTGIR